MMRPPATDARLPRMATKPRATRRPPATPPSPSEESSQRQPPTEPPAKTFKFPTALTVLAIVLLVVWIASFFVPAGKYATNAATGGPQPGTFPKPPNCSVAAAGPTCVDTSFSFRFKQLWDAPPNGLYGVENATGFVSADEQGFLYGSAAIFFFVLAVGAFITVTMKTGAIQTGIGRLAMRFRHSGAVLIALLMSIFAIGGTDYGMLEGRLGFFLLLFPPPPALRSHLLV